MLRNVKSPFQLEFTRSGGALVTARLDVWQATNAGWQPAAQYEFRQATQPREVVTGTLAQGSYTCVFQCYVEESLNGKYAFSFSVGGVGTYSDSGDVNTTSAPNESKVYKDQFILVVQ